MKTGNYITTKGEQICAQTFHTHHASLLSRHCAALQTLMIGLTDLQEAFLGTNPNNVDSDNDGLTDGDEVFVNHSDPLSPDHDGDGSPDWIELAQGRNPNSPTLPGSVTDTNNRTGLRVYTPLK